MSFAAVMPIRAMAAEAVSQEMKQELELLRHEQNLTLFDLGELVPTTEERLGPTSRIFEVTARDILDQNARNVGDALRFVPGLFLATGGTKNPSFAVIRGLTARQNVVFIDGRPVYDPYFGDVDLNNLPIDNVEKIKIVKGPVDAGYGPNALGGVINIITKRGTPEPTTRVNVSYEQHNTQDYWLEHGGQKGNLNYYVAGSYRTSNGFNLPSDFTPTSVQGSGLRQQSAYDKSNVSFNLGYDFTPEDKLAFLFSDYHAELDVPVNVALATTGRLGLSFTRFTDWKRRSVDFYGQTKLFDLLQLKGNVYYDRFKNDLVIFTNESFSRISDISKDTNDVVGANFQGTVDVAPKVRLKAGTFLKHDNHLRKEERVPTTTEDSSFTADFFAVAEYSPLENLLVSLGFNYDVLYPGSGRTIDSYNPRGAVIYKPLPDTRLYTAIGEKSRLPRLLNLFSGRTNLDLTPEKNFSVEVGGDQLLWNDRLEFGATWFRNELDDVIGFVRFPDRSTQDQNLTSLTTSGIETYAVAKLTKDLVLSADYTYTGLKIDNRAQPTSNRFYHQINSRLSYTAPLGVGIFLQGSYIDGEPNTSADFTTVGQRNRVNFFLLDGKVSYEVWKGIKPFLAVENILDSNYERTFGFPQAGRSFFFGVNARF
jgi:iron complex outermembrane recepter protein